MQDQIHTVLGASGAIGRAVIHELKLKNLPVRVVERTAKPEEVSTIKADLLNENEAIKAIQGSTFVYLCVGLPYQTKIWTRDWVKLMQNVIIACEKTNAKLIFFDNVYMYGPTPLSVPFNEQHPQHPATKKGLARKNTNDILLKAIAVKRIEAVIGRSADFYGELAINSPFYISFLQNMLKGKAPNVLGKKGVLHTYAYSGDNGKALLALALDETTYGQVWHLPVGKPITFDEVNEMLNAALGTNFKVGYVSKIMRKILSVFIPAISEVEEMLYQFESRYEMSCEKFMRHFPDFQITSYEKGIHAMAQSFKK